MFTIAFVENVHLRGVFSRTMYTFVVGGVCSRVTHIPFQIATACIAEKKNNNQSK